MSSCGSCATCSQGVPICVGDVCMRPEEAVVSSGFLLAGVVACLNFFVAQRDAVKARLSQSRRLVIFAAIPMVFFAVAVQYGYVEIPTMDAIQNSLGLGNSTAFDGAAPSHGHSHGHAQWHADHIGHFHDNVKAHLAKQD